MIVTFTTVGYGDTSPTTISGKCITIVAMLVGVVFMAMPLSIVGNNFTLAWEERAKERVIVRIQRLCIEREISLAGVQDLFDSADSDQTGMLGYLEFCAFLRKLGLDLPPSQMRHMFRMFDEASNGATRRASDPPRAALHASCTSPAHLLLACSPTTLPPPPRSQA